MSKLTVSALVLSGVVLTQAHAAAGELGTAQIRVRFEHGDLSSPGAAQRLLRRIGGAALEACGASPFSLAEFRTATVASRCYKDAVGDAVRRIDDPVLTAALEVERVESHR